MSAPGPRHIEETVLADYIEALVHPAVELAHLDDIPADRDPTSEHIFSCTSCIDRAQAFLDASESIDAWTARAHGAAYWEQLLDRATVTVTPGLAGRLSDWRSRGKQFGDFAANLILAAREGGRRIVAERVQAIHGSAASFELAPALQTLGRADGSEPATRSPFKVILGIQEGALFVRVHGLMLSAGAAPPLVLVAPKESGGDPIVGQLQPLGSSGSFIARLEGLASGAYTVLIESTGQTEET